MRRMPPRFYEGVSRRAVMDLPLSVRPVVGAVTLWDGYCRGAFDALGSCCPDLPGGDICLYPRALEAYCRDPDELADEVRKTVHHEVGHLLGFDEEELTAIGL